LFVVNSNAVGETMKAAFSAIDDRAILATSRDDPQHYSGPQMVDHSGQVHLLRLFPFSAPPNLAPIDFSRGLIIKRLMGTLLIVELEVGRQA
jgi:hypothetical protein